MSNFTDLDKDKKLSLLNSDFDKINDKNKFMLKKEISNNDFNNAKYVFNQNTYDSIINNLRIYIENIIIYFHPDRKRSERERLFISFLSNLFYSLANLMIKFISKYYPDADANTTSLYRFIIMFILSYIYIIGRKIEFISVSNINSKYILALRIISAYLISFCLAKSTYYLRLGTAISFFFVSPIFTSIASIYFFNDKCKKQNVIGLTICMISMILISLSESEMTDTNPNLNSKLGIIWGSMSLISTVSMIITTKLLVIEIDSMNLNYLIGKFSTLIGLILCVISGNLLYINIGYIILTSLNGLFFWCALYFMNLSLKINNLIAISCIGFLSLVYAFGFGIIFFNENVKLTDIIASFLIFSFNLYSIIFPVSQDKVIDKETNNSNNVRVNN